MLVFTCHPQEMTPERVARTGEFCTWFVPCPGPLGPFDVDASRHFTADPTLFAAPLIQQRDGTWVILGFRNLQDRGGESFEICDPIPVTLDEDGYLRCAAVTAPRRGGARRSCIRSTPAALPTGMATARATFPA